jgi:hypothetical protein
LAFRALEFILGTTSIVTIEFPFTVASACSAFKIQE